jgi:hypothetical protein
VLAQTKAVLVFDAKTNADQSPSRYKRRLLLSFDAKQLPSSHHHVTTWKVEDQHDALYLVRSLVYGTCSRVYSEKPLPNVRQHSFCKACYWCLLDSLSIQVIADLKILVEWRLSCRGTGMPSYPLRLDWTRVNFLFLKCAGRI